MARSRRTFLRFFASYSVLFIIPLVVSIFVYTRTVNQLTRNELNNNLSQLKNGSTLVDRYFEEIDSEMRMLSAEERVRDFLVMKSVSEDRSTVYKLFKAMQSVEGFYYGYAHDAPLYIYSRTSGITISQDHSYMSLSELYPARLRYEDIGLSDWIEGVLHKNQYMRLIPQTQVTINGRQRQMLTYITSYPIDVSRARKGCLYRFVPVTALYNLLFAVDGVRHEGAVLYILNADGEVLLHSDESANLDGIPTQGKETTGSLVRAVNGQQMLVAFVRSPESGWLYLYMVPQSVVMQPVNYMKMIIVLSVIGTFLLGCLLAVLLSQRISKPLIQMITATQKLLPEDMDNESNEFRYMTQMIHAIERNQQKMEGILDEQRNTLCFDFVERLLKSRFKTEKEMREAMSAARLDLKGDGFVVLAFDLAQAETGRHLIDHDFISAQFYSVVSPYIKTRGAAVLLDDKNAAIVLCVRDPGTNGYRAFSEEICRRVQEEMLNTCRIKVACGAGRMYISLLDADRSYMEALQVLESGWGEPQNGLLWYDQSACAGLERGTMFYPLELEQNLIGCMKSGNLEGVARILNAIYEANCEKNRVSADMRRMLLNMLESTIVRSGFEAIEIDKDQPISLKSSFDAIGRHMMRICTDVSASQKSHNKELIRDILTYLEEHYTDASIGLYPVASSFKLSPMYLSSFFKEQVGENFVKYLAKLRIARAGVLLRDTDLSINEISRMVGYSDVRTFRVAFKKIHGVTPNDQRKQPE